MFGHSSFCDPHINWSWANSILGLPRRDHDYKALQHSDPESLSS